MVRGKVTELMSLLVDDVGCVLDLVVNYFTVLHVDQWSEEHDSVSHESKTPRWHNSDQAVGEQCRKENLEIPY